MVVVMFIKIAPVWNSTKFEAGLYDTTGFFWIEIISIYHSNGQTWEMESDISDLLDLAELMISQGFRLLKSVTSGKIKESRMRLELG